MMRGRVRRFVVEPDMVSPPDGTVVTRDGEWTTYGPPEHELLIARVAGSAQGFVEDCRHFARTARDVKLDELYRQFDLTWEEFCVRWLHQPAAVVDAILVGVDVIGEEIPIPAETARRIGSRVIRSRQLAADPTTTALAGHGGKRTAQEIAADSTIPPLSGEQGSIATLKPGRGAEYLVRRLKRDAPEIAAALGRGEYRSARAAAIAAGIIQTPTAEDRRLCALLDAWQMADLNDRQLFLTLVDEEIEAAQEGRMLKTVPPPRASMSPWQPADGVDLLALEALLPWHGVNGVARLLGVSGRTVRRWRAGKTNPSDDVRAKLDELAARREGDG